MGEVAEATERAVQAATHLTVMDDGAIEMLRLLAARIDAGLSPQDNVSTPTYLRYCESLGLTPLSREKLSDKGGTGVGKLAQLRSVAANKRPA